MSHLYTKLAEFQETSLFNGSNNPLDNPVFDRRAISNPVNASIEQKVRQSSISTIENRLAQSLSQIEKRLAQLNTQHEKRFHEIENALRGQSTKQFGQAALFNSTSLLKIVKNGENYDVNINTEELLKLSLICVGIYYISIKLSD